MNDDRFDEVIESIEAEPDLQDPVFFAAAESRTEYDEDVFALDDTAMASDDDENREDERNLMSHYTDDFDPDSIYQPRESFITQAGTIQYLYDDEEEVTEDEDMFLADYEDDSEEDVFATYEANEYTHEHDRRVELLDAEIDEEVSEGNQFDPSGFDQEESASFASDYGNDYDSEQFLDNDDDFLEEEESFVEEDGSGQQFEDFEQDFAGEASHESEGYEDLREELEEGDVTDTEGDFTNAFGDPEEDNDNGSAPFFATDEDIEEMEREDDGVEDPFYVGPSDEAAGSDVNFDIDEELRFSHGISTGSGGLMQTALIVIGVALTSLLSLVIFAPKMVEPFLPKEVLVMLDLAPEEDPFWGNVQIESPGKPGVSGQGAPNQASGEKNSLKSGSKAAIVGQEASNQAVVETGESPESKVDESKLEGSDLKSGQDSPSEIAILPGQADDSKDKSFAPNGNEQASIVPDSANGIGTSINNEGSSATDLNRKTAVEQGKPTDKNKVSNPVGEKRDAKETYEVKEKREDVSKVVKATSPINSNTLTNAKSEANPAPLLDNQMTKGVNYPYEVQIAAAGNAATGNSLAKQVQSQGFSATVYKIQVNGRSYHRVVIRTPSRAEAESIGAELFSKGIVKEKPFVRKVP